MFKVVAVDSVRLVPTVERGILAEADAELFTADCHGEEDVIRATEDAHALLVSLSPITRRVIASWSRNRVVARYGIGVDTVDLQAATDHGIYVTNVPDFCYDEVSDTAMSLILAVTRKLVRMHSLVSRGVYNRKLAMPIYKARGQTLGLLAFGRIARSVARKAAPFGYRVLAHDPYLQPDSLAGQPVELVGLEECWHGRTCFPFTPR